MRLLRFPQAAGTGWTIAPSAIALAVMSACAGCAGNTASGYGHGWDGRRGYDGNGDYGYDLAASQAEAGRYRAQVATSYPAPGPAADPWAPYIREAAMRFQVPERWIREVMRQESGGHQYDSDGTPITSSAGAMGLMQVMPRTYDMLRARYGLATDPYDPHNNILAGTAYIHEMYQSYGSPGFLAAYNAGPDRLDSYLAGGGPLPDETVNYLASVAPRLGSDLPATGPLAVYAGGAGNGSAGARLQTASAAVDPADRAFDGGGLVTPNAPTGVLTAVAPRPPPVATPVPVAAVAAEPSPLRAAAVATPAPVPMTIPFGRTPPAQPSWGIQVGAFPDPVRSEAMIELALQRGGGLLAGTQSTIAPVQRDGMLYRARLVGLSAETAAAACSRLAGQGMPCFAVPPGS